MNILLLGRGKTGLLVADVARRRGHHVLVAGATENAGGAALSADKLRDIDVVIDFTAPHCVVSHIETCVKAGKNMVVGTTGWYAEKDRIRNLVETTQYRVGLCSELFAGSEPFPGSRAHLSRRFASRLYRTDLRAAPRY